jgi:RNA polymerase-binding protein DksA
LKIEEVRQTLLAQRKALFRDVAQLEDELLWLETDIESELVERGQNENTIRVLSRLDDRQKAELEEIHRALTKVATGTYGSCDVCGQAIPSSRLEALPAAVTCMTCAQARERMPS